MQDRRQPVGDDDGRAALHQCLQRLLHVVFALGIQRTRRLVQQQDLRVFEDRPRNRDALLLPARQARALLTQVARVAIRQFLDKRVRMGGFGRGDYFVVGGIGPAVTDVVPDIRGEQRRLLRHHGH